MDPKNGQSYGGEDDPLAYGEYRERHGDPAEVSPEGANFAEAGEGERGIIGDTYRKVRGRYQQQNQYNENDSSKPSKGLGSFIFHKLHDAVNDIGSKLDPVIGTGTGTSAGATAHSHTHAGPGCSDGIHNNDQHRYGSSAVERTGNDVKWYVDGCSYMWAVSRAIERATTSIWILDCETPI